MKTKWTFRYFSVSLVYSISYCCGLFSSFYTIAIGRSLNGPTNTSWRFCYSTAFWERWFRRRCGCGNFLINTLFLKTKMTLCLLQGMLFDFVVDCNNRDQFDDTHGHDRGRFSEESLVPVIILHRHDSDAARFLRGYFAVSLRELGPNFRNFTQCL